jgi:hypothetical protein
MDVDAAAVHAGAERDVLFGFQPIEQTPADIQAVKAVRGQRSISVEIGDCCFIEELLEMRGGHRGPSFARCIFAAVLLQRHLFAGPALDRQSFLPPMRYGA